MVRFFLSFFELFAVGAPGWLATCLAVTSGGGGGSACLLFGRISEMPWKSSCRGVGRGLTQRSENVGKPCV